MSLFTILQCLHPCALTTQQVASVFQISVHQPVGPLVHLAVLSFCRNVPLLSLQGLWPMDCWTSFCSWSGTMQKDIAWQGSEFWTLISLQNTHTGVHMKKKKIVLAGVKNININLFVCYQDGPTESLTGKQFSVTSQHQTTNSFLTPKLGLHICMYIWFLNVGMN